jgi:hypothetical protein
MKVHFQNGREEYLPHDVARGFIAAGLATEVIPTPKPVDNSPHFSVELIGLECPTLTIVMRRGTSITGFSGHPDSINDRQDWEGGGRFRQFGIAVPADVCEKYKHAWKANPALRGPHPGQDKTNYEEAKAAAEKYLKDSFARASR